MNQYPIRYQISENECLKRGVISYYNCDYRRYRQPGNPDFINIVKNQFNDESAVTLQNAKNTLRQIFINDLSYIMQRENLPNCVCLCVPRSKAFDSYDNTKLNFSSALSEAVEQINGIANGVYAIKRVVDTRTTHLNKTSIENNGDLPYPDITKNTCEFVQESIVNQNIILVDDIYTRGVNIDEDCIQALFDLGANNVIFYSVAKTRKNSFGDDISFPAYALLALKQLGVIKNNAQFWNEYNQYSNVKYLYDLFSNNQQYLNKYYELRDEFKEHTIGFICALDDAFQNISANVNNNDRPFIIFYNGNLSLLKNKQNNVCLVDKGKSSVRIEEQEYNVLAQQINQNKVLVSDLSRDLGDVALNFYNKNKAPAIAVSSFPLTKLYFNDDDDFDSEELLKGSNLIKATVYNNGLVVSEYYEKENYSNSNLRVLLADQILF